MKRRQFHAFAAALAVGLPRIDAAWAQAAPAEGREYRQITPPVPVSVPAGKIDVVEFFSYACPHCFEFEPALEDWLKRLPPAVQFHRIPVPSLFNAANFQPLYFALEAMNLVDAMQLKVFNTVHVEHQHLLTTEDIAALMAKNGIDTTKFMAAFNAFGVRAKVQQSKQLMQAYQIDQVPMLAVQGRYLTSPVQAGGAAQALRVVDVLVQTARAGH